MVHHSSDPMLPAFDRLKQQMEIEAQRMSLGATQRTPAGQVHESDEGEICFGIANDPVKQKVYINFGKPVAWLGLSPGDAREIGESLIKHSLLVRGTTD